MFPPAIEFEERRKLEKLIVKGLLAMDGDLKGDYFPLNGSQSYAPKPNGMSLGEEEALRKMGNLFQEPDSTLLLASGMAKCWPDGRGVFHNEGRNLFVWVGEEDHMRIVSMQGSRDEPSAHGKNIKGRGHLRVAGAAHHRRRPERCQAGARRQDRRRDRPGKRPPTGGPYSGPRPGPGRPRAAGHRHARPGTLQEPKEVSRRPQTDRVHIISVALGCYSISKCICASTEQSPASSFVWKKRIL